MGILRLIVAFLRAFVVSRAVLAAEYIALRHQLTVLQRSVKRLKLRKRDRIFWACLVKAVVRLEVHAGPRAASDGCSVAMDTRLWNIALNNAM